MKEKQYQLTAPEFFQTLFSCLMLNKKVFNKINLHSEVKFYHIVFIYIGTALVSLICFISLLLLIPLISKLGLFPSTLYPVLPEVLGETLPITFLLIQIATLLAISLQLIISCLLNPSLLINKTKLNKYFLSICYSATIFLWLWISVFICLFLKFPYEDYLQTIFVILILCGLTANFLNASSILVNQNRLKLLISCLWPLIFIIKLI